MKTYNRALDYTALALNELRKGNHVLSAKLLLKAGQEADLPRAIQILEASNAHAFKVEETAKLEAKAKLEADAQAKAGEQVAAKKRLQAADEGEEVAEEGGDEEVVEAADEGDPLDEIEDEEDDEDEPAQPAEAMASVLAKMVRRSS